MQHVQRSKATSRVKAKKTHSRQTKKQNKRTLDHFFNHDHVDVPRVNYDNKVIEID